MTAILSAHVRSLDLPLVSPYKLSFGTLEAFRSSIVEIELEGGGKGVGEVTALPGYGDETADTVQSVLTDSVSGLPGKSVEQARETVAHIYTQHPFAASALGTALDIAAGDCVLPATLSVPLSWTIAASHDTEELPGRVTDAFEHGYRTIKVKVGEDHAADMATAEKLLGGDLSVTYRFDANQGYTCEQARSFLELMARLGGDRGEYLEQPFPRGSWEDDEALNREFPGHLLLDESIYDEDDIGRAAAIGVSLIKMKLAKTRGPAHLLAVTRLAKEYGMRVVLGNGVATDVSNMVEAAVFTAEEGLFHGAFEGNGFLKFREAVMHSALREEDGVMVLRSASTSGIPACPERSRRA